MHYHYYYCCFVLKTSTYYTLSTPISTEFLRNGRLLFTLQMLLNKIVQTMQDVVMDRNILYIHKKYMKEKFNQNINNL